MQKIGLSLAFILLLFACHKAELDNSLSQTDTYGAYFPMQSGDEMLYRLDSIVPAAFGTRLDTHRYYLKDVVGSLSVENEDSIYVINRYISKGVTNPTWRFQNTYTAKKRKSTLEITEMEMVREKEPIPINELVALTFIKLSNPVKEHYTWNGNRYFTSSNANSSSYLYKYNDWEYTYLNKGHLLEMATGNFTDCITVAQIDILVGDSNIKKPDNYQLRIYGKEVYAKNVGMVYKQLTYTDYQPPNSISPGYQSKSFEIILRRIMR